MTVFKNDMVCFTTKKNTYIARVTQNNVFIMNCFDELSRSGIVSL